MPQRAGLELFLNDRQWTPAVNNFANQMHTISGSLIGIQRQSSQVTKGFDNAAGQIAKSSRNMRNAGGDVQAFGNAIQQGFGVGIGIQAVQAVGMFGQALSNFLGFGFETARFFQQLSFSIGTLSAVQLKLTDDTLSMADALEQGKTNAEGYMMVLQDLAVTSVFNTQDLASGFQLLNTYSMLGKEALVTEAIFADFGSAAGIPGEVLGRMNLAVGQMNTAGRLLSRDVLQLTQASIPVQAILAKSWGKTREEIIKLEEQGLIPAKAAIYAMLKYLQNFEGSGKRATLTLQGLTSTFQDLIQISTSNVMKGVIDPFLPLGEGLVELAKSYAFRGSLTAIGEFIGATMRKAYDAVAQVVGGIINLFTTMDPKLRNSLVIFVSLSAIFGAIGVAAGLLALSIGVFINPFTLVVSTVAAMATAWLTNFGNIRTFTNRVVTDIGNTFGGMINQVVEWGTGTINAFAQGLALGVGAVTKTIGDIGDTIAGLMKTGSPPAFLPDIDKWGQGTADAWLEGWTLADFSVLDNIGTRVEQMLGTFVSQGKMTELDANRAFQALTPLIAQAVDEYKEFGAISAETLAGVGQVAGLAGEETMRLLTLQVKYAASTAAVEAAQSKLNEITNRYSLILDPLQRKLSAITAAQQKGDRAKEMARQQRIINSLYASEARKAQARLELERLGTEQQISDVEQRKSVEDGAAQAQLNTAQAIQDEIKKQLDVYNGRLDAETKQLALFGQEKKILDDIAKLAAKEMSELERQLEAIKYQSDEMADLVDAERQRYIITHDGFTEAEKTAAKLKLQEITLRQIQRRADAISKLHMPELIPKLDALAGIPITVDDLKLNIKGDALTGLNDDIESLMKIDTEGPLKKFNEALAKMRLEIDADVKAFDKWLTDLNDLLPAFLKIKPGVDGAIPALETLRLAFIGLGVALATAKILEVVVAIVTGLGTMSGIIGLIAIAAGVLAIMWTTNMFDIQGKTAVAMADIQAKTKEATDAITLYWAQNGDAIMAKIKPFQDWLTLFGGVWETTFTRGGKIITDIVKGDWADVSYQLDIITGTWRGFFTKTREDIMSLDWGAVGQKIKDAFDQVDWPGTVAKVSQFVLDVGGTFRSFSAGLWDIVFPELSKFLGKFLTWIADPNTWATLARTLIADWRMFNTWVEQIWPDMKIGLAQLYLDLHEWIGKYAPSLQPWLDKFWQFRTDAEAQIVLLGFKMSLVWPQISGYIFDAAEHIGGDLGRILTSLGNILSWFTDNQLLSMVGTLFGGVAVAIAESTIRIVETIKRLVEMIAIGLESIVNLHDMLESYQQGDAARMTDTLKKQRQLARELLGIPGDIHQDLAGLFAPSMLPGSTGAPFRAKGGPVSANNPYVVGEHGPELFVPKTGGTVIPASGVNSIISIIDLFLASRAQYAARPSGLLTQPSQTTISNNNFYLNVSSSTPSAGIVNDFAIMQLMRG